MTPFMKWLEFGWSCKSVILVELVAFGDDSDWSVV